MEALVHVLGEVVDGVAEVAQGQRQGLRPRLRETGADHLHSQCQVSQVSFYGARQSDLEYNVRCTMGRKPQLIYLTTFQTQYDLCPMVKEVVKIVKIRKFYFL